MRFVLPVVGEIEIVTKNIFLEDFVRRQLSNYYIDSRFIDNFCDTNFLIKTKLNYDEWFSKILNIGSQIARRIVISESKIIYENITICKSSEGYIHITADLPFSFKKKLYLSVLNKFNKTKLYGKCHSQFYDYILFPVFLLYALNGFFLIHGSLLKHKNLFYLITGLDGVGKSSLTNSLTDSGDYCISDNFVLYNGKFAVPFTLAVRLSPEQNSVMKTLYSDSNLKECIFVNTETELVVPDKVFLLSISKSFCVRKENVNLLNFIMYLNNAPEISVANKFIGPVLLLNTNSYQEKLSLTILSVPIGKLDLAKKEVENELKEIC